MYTGYLSQRYAKGDEVLVEYAPGKKSAGIVRKVKPNGVVVVLKCDPFLPILVDRSKVQPSTGGGLPIGEDPLADIFG